MEAKRSLQPWNVIKPGAKDKDLGSDKTSDKPIMLRIEQRLQRRRRHAQPFGARKSVR